MVGSESTISRNGSADPDGIKWIHNTEYYTAISATSYNNVLSRIKARQVVVVRGLVDEGDVVGNLALEVKDGIVGHRGAELQGLLVVEEGSRHQAELVHGSAKVVINLLRISHIKYNQRAGHILSIFRQNINKSHFTQTSLEPGESFEKLVLNPGKLLMGSICGN